MRKSTDVDAPAFLTTREVADLLRVKERKVYDLAAAGEIPHRRVTGKLLFPRTDIDAWLARGAAGAAAGPGRRVPPDIVAGSHDPLLDAALRESGSALASFVDGSLDGLARFARGEASGCALHVIEDDGWNVATVAAAGVADCVLVGWARRRQGLILAPSLAPAVEGVADLEGRRVAMRQPGSGGHILFSRLAAEAGVDASRFVAGAEPCRTEVEAAAAVACGDAEATLGLESMARQFRLDFLPLTGERFDLLVDRRAWFTPPWQRLFAHARGAAFAARAAALGGYDLAGLGEVRWLSD